MYGHKRRNPLYRGWVRQMARVLANAKNERPVSSKFAFKIIVSELKYMSARGV